ncbi:MAG TPA: NUDIX hydrolase [Thermodesulfobacteriota bacterium]|nr:NUDIX hydrolase [Thermodesulfobacteriota bacterium]
MTNHKEGPFFYQGRIFDFKVEETNLPNGRETTIEVIRHPGSTAIVPVQRDQSVILLRQYRPAIRTMIWEIPAGTMHRGEDPLECARRELQEEAGFMGRQFEEMGEILIGPGYSDERIHLFLATDLIPCEQKLDEDEYLEIHSFNFEEVMKMIERGDILDAMTIVGINRAYARLKPRSQKEVTCLSC